MRTLRIITGSLCVAMLTGCSRMPGVMDERPTPPFETAPTGAPPQGDIRGEFLPSSTKHQDFSHLHSSFRFSAEIPRAWDVEFVSQITALNIYDPNHPSPTAREQSQIFIRQFTADRFLTLSTVNILAREETTVHGHPSVRYEIEKKAGVPDFPHQPSWRSERHKLTDVRFTQASPSLFYVFAHRPELADDVVETFFESLRFHNDTEGFAAPLPQLSARPILKPFGLKISPEDSPIQPERFSGYHTGVDFEVFEEEKDQPVIVSAVCGGELRTRQRTEGYGGLVVQECLLHNEPVTVIYGHLDLGSIQASPSDYLAPGDPLGKLGEQGLDTDGERTHLHLGIHRGSNVVITGYADREEDLQTWIDPMTILQR